MFINPTFANILPSIARDMSTVVVHSNNYIYIRLAYGPGVDSASNRNEYQENFLGVNAAGAAFLCIDLCCTQQTIKASLM